VDDDKENFWKALTEPAEKMCYNCRFWDDSKDIYMYQKCGHPDRKPTQIFSICNDEDGVPYWEYKKPVLTDDTE